MSTTSKALDLLGGFVLEDGRCWGEAAEEFQWIDAGAILDPEGRPYHFLTRGRGGSKTTDLAAIATVMMIEVLPPGSDAYALAADRDQGRLLVDAIRGFAARTPGLAEVLDIDAYRVTVRGTGTILDVLAADAPGTFGLRPSFLIIDELAQWTDTPTVRTRWAAASTAIAKLRGARMVVLTSAGDPAHWSFAIREHARVDPLWRIHEVPGPPPWLDPERVAEQKRRLTDSQYRRYFLNEWVADDDRLTSRDEISACLTHTGDLAPRQGVDYVIGVDLGWRHDPTALAVCHRSRQQRQREGQTLEVEPVIVDHLQIWEPRSGHDVDLTVVEQCVADTARAYHRAQIVCDPTQFVGIAQRLGHSFDVIEYPFTQTSIGRIAGALLRLISERLLGLPDDAGLIEELVNLRVREAAPGVLRLDHDAQHHDDRAIAIGLAAQQLLNRPPVRQVRLVPSSSGGSPGIYFQAPFGGIEYYGGSDTWGG
jgi:hypothetical protein